MNVKDNLTDASGEKYGLETSLGARSRTGRLTASLLIAKMSALLTIVRRKAAACLIRNNRDKSGSIVAPNGLTWDNSIIELSTRTMKEMEVSHGDVALVARLHGKKTLVVCLANDVLDDGSVSVSSDVRRNLGANIGSSVYIWSRSKLRYLERVAVVLIGGNFECPVESIFDFFLVPYFNKAYRPLMQDDIFTCTDGPETATFKVTALDPLGYGIVGQDTLIFLDVSNRQPAMMSPKEPGRGLYGRALSLFDAIQSSRSSIGMWLIVREEFGEECLGHCQSHSCSTEALILRT